VRLQIDREAAATYGVTSNAAIQSLTWALRGAALPRFQDVDRELPLIIEYDEEEVAGLDTIRDLSVFTATSVVPLSAFGEIEFQPGAGQIHRWNGKITFNIQARVKDPSRQMELVKAGYAALQALELPRGFSLGMDDSAVTRQAEEVNELTNALLLSVVLIFLLMGILFESLLLPISVLTTIPFAILGALWTIYLTGTTMDTVGFIGLIILVGVVVNNGIVLIDKIHRSRGSTANRTEAVLAGSAARVRPILMTALTTVFGLLPMALGEATNNGIDYRALATCVAGGLVISTFFTLWIVPLAYTVMDDLTHILGGTLRRNLGRGRRGS
jgi:HAE1 family hydrophobic/amphiphilic exporter-1